MRIHFNAYLNTNSLIIINYIMKVNLNNYFYKIMNYKKNDLSKDIDHIIRQKFFKTG